MTTSIPHDYYLQGKELLAHNTPEDNDAAIACFQKALELDATYAPAYAGLSLAYAQRAAPLGLGLGLGSNWLDNAISAAEKAIEIAPNLDESYCALATAYYRKGWHRKQVEASRKLLELNPNQASGVLNPGWPLWFTGHADEALPYLKNALALAPASAWAYFYVGNASLALELYDQAEEMYGKAVELENLSSGQIGLICTYLSEGKQEQAIEQNRRFRASPDEDRYFVKAADIELLLGNPAEARAFAEKAAAEAPEARYFPRGVYATTILGCVFWDEDREAAQRRLDQSADMDRTRLDEGDESFMPRYDLAAVNAIRGEKAEAHRWLQSAIDAGWRTYRLAMRDPLLQNLHNDQQFQQMMTQVKAKIEAAKQHMQHT